MPGFAEANSPSYISAHSADVILSDIRPFKLKADALRSINVLLDELLYNILSSSGSLVTDRLRASLLGLLPTSLGKEALLEAEVELRAYWERTAPAGIFPSVEDDTLTFHLPGIFELLRNKCEAYSTLNETDEDPSTEAHINEQFGRSGASPPKAALVAPAALYLTAILEAVCEHVLSNVGRVAARDSSRTSATTNDLFIALCEDASIYGYFRTMKVYDQIEQLSKAPRPSRRSKSFTRNDKGSMSRTSTPQQEPGHMLTGSLSRQSSESSSGAGNGHVANNPSRSSFDKSRALRMFSNGKTSHEREESQSGHKKSSSFSDNAKQGSYEDEDFVEDAAMIAEFDDLMRSASTMKMSLTPDRLRTMEVYKQEKDQRGNRRPAALTVKSEADAPSSRPPLPSIRHVDSIVEDDEEGSSPKQSRPIHRQGSVSVSPSASSMSPPSRSRSVSTSGAGLQTTARKPVRSPAASIPSAYPSGLAASASNPNMAHTRMIQANSRGAEPHGGPIRKRTKQRNRESLDLDDIMNGVDDDEVEAEVPPTRSPTTPPKRTPKVSSTTRELMDFLAEGPPDAPSSREGSQLIDFLGEGPPKSYGTSSASLEKPKTGRLQRMISKLNIGSEKPRSVPESPVKSTSGHYRTSGASQYPAQSGAFSPLANRPIPPRPPRPPQPISPPPSPSQVSLVDKNNKVPARKVSITQDPLQFRTGNAAPSSPSSPSKPTTHQVLPKSIMKEIPSPRSILHVNDNGHAPQKPGYAKTPAPDNHPSPPPSQHPITHSLTRKPVPKEDLTPPPVMPIATPGISEADMRDVQRLFSSATNADECRLIFDMYMTRSRRSQPPAATPYPIPSSSLMRRRPTVSQGEAPLENSLVELFLSGGNSLAATLLPLAAQPSPSKARRLPRVPKPEHANIIHVQQEKDEEKPIPIAAWNNTTEFPAHIALIPA